MTTYRTRQDFIKTHRCGSLAHISTAWLARGSAQGPSTPRHESTLRHLFSQESPNPESLLIQQAGNRKYDISPWRRTESNRGRRWALPLQTAFPLAVSSLLCVLLPQAVLAVLVPLVSPQLPAGLTLPGLAWPRCQRTAKCVACALAGNSLSA